MRWKLICSIHTWTKEEDVAVEEEAKLAKGETIENRHMNILSIIGKTLETIKELSTGGGAFMLD